MARPMILAYSLTDERMSRLTFLCMRTGVLARRVAPEDAGQPIGALCGLSDRIDDAPEAVCPEEMLVFCHMDNGAVSRFLQSARQMKVRPFALKAMLTPTNVSWNAAQLCAELQEERASISANSSPAHDQQP